MDAMVRPPSSIFLRNQSAVYVPKILYLVDWSPTPKPCVISMVRISLVCSAGTV
jgi:hypothetical protein